MSNFWNNIFAVIILLGTAGSLVAQPADPEPKDNSPYSRLGLGDLMTQYFAANAGMGGLRAALHDPYHINLINPAATAWLEVTAFEVGFFGEYAELESGDDVTTAWNGNLKYIALGFPLQNPINEVLERERAPFRWGMNFALTPYSNVEYDIETTSGLPGRDTMDVISAFEGLGGTYKVAWTNAFRYKNFSAGVSLGYIFGKITNSRSVFLDDQFYYFDNFNDEFSLSGFLWNAGLQYDWVFKEMNREGELEPTGKRITFGLYGNANNSFTTNSSSFYTREFVSTVPNVDTLRNTREVEGNGTLPAELGFGVMYSEENKLRVGADYVSTSWSNYENDAKPESLSNSWRLSTGIEYTPNYSSYNSYLERIRYRGGFYYATDPRSFNGTQINEWAVTFGLGMPIIMPRQQTSFVNLAVEYGKFGIETGLQETFTRVTLGFTLNDNTWFFKRKFN